MSLIARFWWALFYATLAFFIFAFLGAVGLVPVEKGMILSNFGFVLLIVVAFMELTSLKL